MAEIHDVGEIVILALGNRYHLLALRVAQELAVAVKKLEGVPLYGIVARSDDYAAVGMLARHGKLNGRSSCQTDVDYIKPHRHDSAGHDMVNHRPGYAGITSPHYTARARILFLYEFAVGCGEFRYIHSGKALAASAAYGAADSGYRFYQ